MFNFNETIDRRHTNCVKWDTVETSYHEKDLLPLWVADMDFKVHQPILDALSQVIEQGILGYAVAPNELYQAIQDWQRQHHQLIVEKKKFCLIVAWYPVWPQPFKRIQHLLILS